MNAVQCGLSDIFPDQPTYSWHRDLVWSGAERWSSSLVFLLKLIVNKRRRKPLHAGHTHKRGAPTCSFPPEKTGGVNVLNENSSDGFTGFERESFRRDHLIRESCGSSDTHWPLIGYRGARHTESEHYKAVASR